MSSVAVQTVVFALLVTTVLVQPRSSFAQIVAPSQITPQNLQPESRSPVPNISLTAQPSPGAPPGSEDFNVLVANVVLQGAFSEMAQANQRFTDEISGTRVSVARIYALADALEKDYARSGYVFARVTVPPQHLVDQGRLEIVVVDGFIEDVDVSGVPDRARGLVLDRMSSLIGLHHVRLVELERRLLIAANVPGLKLKSTLMRGTSDGGTRLVLTGEHDLVTGSLGVDNKLSALLGTWQLRGTVAVNSVLGLGEQVYGTVGLGADLRAALDGTTPLKVYGGGVIIPVGHEGITLNPEYTHSATQSPALPGTPASVGTFDRWALRLQDPVLWTRSSSLNVNVAVEYISQQVAAPAFGVNLNEDRYGVTRIGADYATSLHGIGLQVGGNLSLGLGGRSEADALMSGIPLSRDGTEPNFQKITANARITQPLPADLRLDLIGASQYSFSKPMLRSEQFALDGSDAVSAFSAGTFSVDQGATLRAELLHPFAIRFEAATASISPYLFGSAGHGWFFNATSVEQSVVNAGALGIGARSSVQDTTSITGLSLGVELARKFSDVPGARGGWRGNVNGAVTF